MPEFSSPNSERSLVLSNFQVHLARLVFSGVKFSRKKADSKKIKDGKEARKNERKKERKKNWLVGRLTMLCAASRATPPFQPQCPDSLPPRFALSQRLPSRLQQHHLRHRLSVLPERPSFTPSGEASIHYPAPIQRRSFKQVAQEHGFRYPLPKPVCYLLSFEGE